MDKPIVAHVANAAPRSEQETIITYDRELDEWHFYSDCPKHCRKWQARISPTRAVVNSAGELVVLEGTITHGTVSISKTRTLTAEQRAKTAARFKAMREAKRNG